MESPAAETSVSLPRTELNYMKAVATYTRFLGMPEMRQNICKSLFQIKAMIGIGMATEKRFVELNDARAAGLDYGKVGFTLQPLKSEVIDWTSVPVSGTPSNELYKKELEAVIRKLHPTVVKVEWSAFLVRGGPGENGPASGGIHLDYFPDKEQIQKFLASCGDGSSEDVGYNDFRDTVNKHPDLNLGFILGLWKPRNKCTPVCESPLIMCDPRTVDIKDAVPQQQNFKVFAEGRDIPVANLSANLKHSDAHKWYYYPEQIAEELTVFRHYTAQEYSFANFHCAGVLPLPEGREGRSSVETRAFLFFEKEMA